MSSTRMIIKNLYPPRTTFEQMVVAAIKKKSEKRHQDKDRTVLIVENRTLLFGIRDILALQAGLVPDILTSPFKVVASYSVG